MSTQQPAPPSPVSDSATQKADRRHLVNASMIVVAAGAVAKVLGVLRESATSAVFGSTRALDGFIVAKTLPDMFSTWVEIPVRAAFVPLFTRIRAEQGEDEAWRAASNILNLLALLLVGLTAVLVLTSGLLVRALSPGFQDQAAWRESTANAQVVVVSVLFSVLATILGSLLSIYRRQGLSAAAQVANGAVTLAAVLWLGPRIGLMGFAIGLLGGSIAQFAIQAHVLWRHRAQYRLIVQPGAAEVRDLMVIALPLFIGLTGPRIDVFFDRAFTSFLEEGSITRLYFGFFVANVAADLVLVIAGYVLLPHFASLVAEGRFAELQRRLAQSLAGFLFLMMPVTVVLCVAARPVIDLIYTHGKFTPESAALTAVVLPVLAFMGPAQGFGQIIAQVFISRGDTLTPMKIGFWRIGFKLVLSVILLFGFKLGILGLAIATTASTMFRAGQLWWRLPAELRPDRASLGGQLVRLTVAGLIAAAAVLAVVLAWSGGGAGLLAQMVRVGSICAVSVAVFVGACLALRVEIAGSLLSRVLRRGAA